MIAETLWRLFCEKESLPVETRFDAWQLGGTPDYLAFEEDYAGCEAYFE